MMHAITHLRDKARKAGWTITRPTKTGFVASRPGHSAISVRITDQRLTAVRMAPITVHSVGAVEAWLEA
jgi:hypothetical protein